MQRAQLLVKNLTTIETLGTVNVICCEKTGTVTQRRMVPRRLGFADEAVELAGPMSGHVDGSGDPALRRVFETAALCNAARFDPLSAQLPVDEREALGDATDCALLRLAEHLRPQLGRDEPQYSRLLTIPFSLRRRWMLTVCKADSGPPFVLVKGAPETLLPRCSQVQTRSGALVPLSAEMRARLEGMQRNWATSDGCRVLLLCRRDFDSSSNGGVAANPLAELEDKPAALHALASQSVEDLTVVGLVGLVDPPRDEILDSVGRLHRAGVRVFMVTGDYAPTAAHVARQCGMITGATVDGIREAMARAAFGFSDKQPAGATADAALDRHSTAQPACCPQPPGVPRRRLSIADSDHTLASRTALVVSGPELPGLRSEHWDAVLSYDECVFARITPEQKLQIVEEMRARGLIVAVTGDEVNDVPAMQAAHVGVAMGNGTEVAKEAAEMVLVDNNFASLLVAIESGRLLFVNLKKVIVYLLPMTNLSEIVPSLLNVVLGLPIPLSTFLMLVINTVTDVWASVLLAYEEPETDLMLHAPRDPAVDGLVNVRFFVQAYGFVGLVQTLTGHVMFFLCLYLRGGIGPGHVFLAFNKWTDGYQGKTREQLAQLVSMAGSAHFMALVVMQWANMFVARTRVLSVFRQNPLWGPRSNPLLLVAVPISVAVALFFNEIGWFNRVFLTGRIPVEFFFLPIPFAVALLVLEELRKLAVRRHPSGVIARIAW
ncbi:hypothetical protein H4R23_000570 [Coemansia sp. Cherry 401B]|nr:hypothetical protein H4R23_000570 [Coemansia sp. Cherry 401B]